MTDTTSEPHTDRHENVIDDSVTLDERTARKLADLAAALRQDALEDRTPGAPWLRLRGAVNAREAA